MAAVSVLLLREINVVELLYNSLPYHIIFNWMSEFASVTVLFTVRPFRYAISIGIDGVVAFEVSCPEEKAPEVSAALHSPFLPCPLGRQLLQHNILDSDCCASADAVTMVTGGTFTIFAKPSLVALLESLGPGAIAAIAVTCCFFLVAGIWVLVKVRAVKKREAKVHVGEQDVEKGKAQNLKKSKELDLRDAELRESEKNLEREIEKVKVEREEMQQAYSDKLEGLQDQEAMLEAKRSGLVSSEVEAGMKIKASALSKTLLAQQVHFARQGAITGNQAKEDQVKRFHDAMGHLENTQAVEAESAKERLRRRLERKNKELKELLEGADLGAGGDGVRLLVTPYLVVRG